MQLLINVVIDFQYDDHQVPSEPVTHVNTTLALTQVNCKDRPDTNAYEDCPGTDACKDHPGTDTCKDHPGTDACKDHPGTDTYKDHP